MLKDQLVQLLQRKKEEIKTDLETYAESRGHRILWTPPRHSELQPIELYWAAVKGEVARQFTSSRSLPETKNQLLSALRNNGTPEKCASIIRHCNNTLKELIDKDLQYDARHAEEENPEENEEDDANRDEGDDGDDESDDDAQ